MTRGAESWRSDGDLSFGLFLIDKGCEAIGVTGDDDDADAGTCQAGVTEGDNAQLAAAIYA